jgi:transcriptional regulator with XRE-family HTH domain
MGLHIGRCQITNLLKEVKLTQAELADRCGMSESTISHYVTKRRIMSIQNAKIIAMVLKVKIDDLYSWDGIE